MGVPTLGCGCAVCTSVDPHDKRLRPSVLVRWMEGDRQISISARTAEGREAGATNCPGTGATGCPETGASDFGGGREGVERVVVIDTGPDFREQALREKLTRVDAVFYTHSHADHIFGLDDLRPLSFAAYRNGGMIPLYASSDTRAVLERIYEYTFSPDATYPNRAKVRLEPLEERNSVHGVEFVRVPLMHGNLEISGFRFGSFAYLTDVSEIPDSSFALLEGVDQLVVSALRYKPHPSHATVEQAIGWARKIGAKETWLTHIAHELGHEETNRALPEGIRMAYDGLKLAVSL